MLIINQNFNKSMEVGTEKCLLSRVCPKLTAYQNFNKSMEVGTEKCLLSRICPKLTAYGRP